jgi:hypothetical protein
MRAHQIENGVVVNTIEVTSLDVLPNLIEATEGGIGWTYVDGVFTEPVVVTPPAPTKEELLAQVQALTAKINALG